MDKTLKCVYYNNLFDIYGNLLNEREREIFILFYEEDYSLQEIADIRRISKSAIGNTIKIVNQKLEEYEKKLGFFEKIEQLKLISTKIQDENLRQEIEKVLY